MKPEDGQQVTDVDSRLREQAMLCPDALALADSRRRLSWQALDEVVNKIANSLIETGIGANGRVAILGSNSVDYALLFLGSQRAGKCVVPLSTLTSADSLADMINDSEVGLLFVAKDYAETIDSVAGQLTTLMPNGLKNLDYEGDDRQSLASFAAAGSGDGVNLVMRPEWGFNLIYSSGTTGVPKGILQTRRFRAMEREAMAGLGLNSQTRMLLSTPLFSNATLLMFLSVLGNGGTAILMEKFNSRLFLEISESERITHVMLVPVQYERLLNEPYLDKADLSAYQFKLSTSAPLRKSVKEELLHRWPDGGLWELYGMSEGGASCVLVAHDRPDKLETVGQPTEGCDLKVIDNNGQVLPQGETGEIVGRCDRMMVGYHRRPEATSEASWYDDQNQRFQRSGDIGWLDEENFLHLLGREKDMIISGGFNVYAVDLERALLERDDVSEAAVVAAPSAQWGETPVAFIVTNQAKEPDLDEILASTNSKLGKVQRLSKVHLLSELPRSPIGKVLKRELRNMLL